MYRRRPREEFVPGQTPNKKSRAEVRYHPGGKCIQQAIVVRYDCVTIPMETSVLHAVRSNPGLSSCDEQSEDAPPALRRHAIPVFTSWITQC